MKSLRLPEDWEEAAARLLNERGDDQKLEAERQEIWSTLRPMRDNYEKGLYEGDEIAYWRKVNTLRSRLDLLYTISESNIRRASETMLGLGERWEEATKYERQDFLRLMVQEAACDIESQQILWIKPRLEFSALFQLLDCLKPAEGNRFWLSKNSEPGG